MPLAGIISHFHFIRPGWLWGLLLLAFLLWIYARHLRTSRSWQAVCDPQLLPHILASLPGRTRRWPFVIIAFTSILIILALAGPTWKQLEQPVFRDQSALVIVLDLSRSMDAADIKPSRITRARLKVIDILKQRKEGQTALIVYAAEAFTVSPLTDDANTIIAEVSSLDTSLMPNQGSRTDLALDKAMQLLQQGGVPRGDILLITDGINDRNLNDTMTELIRKGDRLSVIGVGTTEGAPIAIEGGGFLKDNDGSIVIPKLDEQSLYSLASKGGGRYRTLSADDSDVDSMLADFASGRFDTVKKQAGLNTDIWQEEGPWLLLLVIPFAVMTFRRGYLLLLVFLYLPVPGPAYAMTWNDLWSRPDQQAAQAFKQGDADKAAKLFNNSQWRAAAYYRAKDYQQSVKALEGINTADALYNKGNALANLGQLPEAIAVYDKALELDPKNEDARYNRDLLQKQLQQQSQNQSRKKSSQQQSQDADSKSGKQGNQDNAQNAKSGQDTSGQNQSQSQNQNQGQNKHNEDNSSSAAQQQESPSRQSPQADNNKQQENSPAADKSTDDKEDKADAAKRDMTQASQENKDQQHEDKDNRAQMLSDSTEHDETQQANEQWLRRIPDDPGGLLRRKFLYQSQQNPPQQNQEEQPW